LSVWSTLEDKYTRSLDEDDIVDLRSGGFYRDRGVLNDKAGTWDFGCFADPKEADLADEGDDEEDDIGGWGLNSELDHQFSPVHIPPVRELDPEDAEDLRAFLAAEHTRKALNGVDDDSSGDEAGLNKGGDDYDHADTEESVLEVDAGSACLSPTESDDDLAGYDDTVGEGALLWEVSTELSNCSEPLGATSGMVPKTLYALPRRHQTPAQLRTPPLSRSSMRPPSVPDLLRKSPQLFRPPLNLPPPSSPKSQKTSPPMKKQASTQYSPDKVSKLESPISTDKGKGREMSLSPTKNLVAEIMLPKRRASTVDKEVEKTRVRLSILADIPPRRSSVGPAWK
jgi:Centromere protein Scm3